MTNTTSKGIEIQLLYAIYIGSSHCSVRLIICDTGGGEGNEIFSDYLLLLDVTVLI